MARRLLQLAVTMIAVAALTASGGVAGGGWAITMVDPFEEPRAGEVLDVSFTILQHGETPVDVADVVLIITRPDGSHLRVPAQPAGAVGRYRAAVEVAEAGRHRWRIQQGIFGPQDLGGFDVAAVAVPSFVATTAVAAGIGVAGTAGLVGLAQLGVRRRRRSRPTDQPLSVSSNPQFSEM